MSFRKSYSDQYMIFHKGEAEVDVDKLAKLLLQAALPRLSMVWKRFTAVGRDVLRKDLMTWRIIGFTGACHVPKAWCTG